MSITAFKSGLAIVAATVAILPLLSAPALAEKKGVSFGQAYANRINTCDVILADLTANEKGADEHAGTPAAKPYAKAADAAWDKGVKNGCWPA